MTFDRLFRKILSHSKKFSSTRPVELTSGYTSYLVIILWDNGVRQTRFIKDIVKDLNGSTLTGHALWLRKNPQYVLRAVKVSREQLEKRYK